MRRSPWPILLAIASFSTLLNCLKPLAVDDSVYYYYAAHIANHPLDPYGFKLFGALPANDVLAPPVFLYWFAAAIRLFGHSPFLWKLWLLPFNLLFVGCLYLLAWRFVRRHALALVALLAFSPVFLPAWNLMLDVPALSLTLCALILFMRACDRGTLTPALLAGLIAGVAMQTKYTAFVAPALFLGYGVCFGRLRAGLLAASLAGLLFVGWELFMSATYGASHFMLAIRDREAPLQAKLVLFLPLIGILGGTASAGILYAQAALGVKRCVVIPTMSALAVGFLAIMFVPESYAVLIAGSQPGRPVLTLNTVVFGSFGLLMIGLSGAVLVRLCRRGVERVWTAAPFRQRRYEYFLLFWLVVEIGAYFALSPYQAVRRVMGVMVVGTLLTGRLAGRTCRSRERTRLVWVAGGFNLVLGLLSFTVDVLPYQSERVAVQAAAEKIRRKEPETPVWYVGTGTFGFYAEELGMKPIIAAHAHPHKNDWVVALAQIYDLPCDRHSAEINASTPIRLRIESRWQLRSKYQCGGSALEHYEGPAVEVHVFRLAADVP